MTLTRRRWIPLAAGFGLLADMARALGANALGANTAIAGYSLSQAIALLGEIGFPVIEIHTMGTPGPTPGQFPGFEFNRLSAAEKEKIRKDLAGFRRITAHLPYAGLEYFSSDAATAAAAVQRVDIALAGAAYFGAAVAVLHPKPGPGQTQATEWRVMLERFRRWGDIAGRNGIRLALETGYPKSVKQFVRLVREVAHPAVGATLDVGHQAQYAELAAAAKDRGAPESIRAYNDVNIELVDRLGPKLFHLHIHDIDPATWKEHRPLGTGFINYPRLISKLREIRYSGSLILEIGAPAAEMPADLRAAKHIMDGYLS